MPYLLYELRFSVYELYGDATILPYIRAVLRFLTYLTAALLACTRLPAQQQYLFSHLGMRDGLASNVVNALQQDSKGYIWIATMSGLERYDGQDFMLWHHRSEPRNSLPNDIVLGIRLDKKNRLWVLCQYNKLGYIDLDKLLYHPVPVDWPQPELSALESNLLVDYEGNIFLFLNFKATLSFDEKTQSFNDHHLPFQMPPGWIATGFFEDSTSHAYYLTGDSGLVKYNVRERTLSYRNHNVDKDPVIEHYQQYRYTGLAFLDQQGNFWLSVWPRGGSGNSFFAYNIHTDKVKLWHPSLNKLVRNVYHEVQRITEQKDGTIWFTGLNVLAILRKTDRDFQPLQSRSLGEFGLYYDNVSSMLEDREGNIWLATDKGVYRFNPYAQVFQTIPNKRPGRDTVFTPDVTDILQISNGDIVVATWGNGLFAYDSSFHPIDRWYVTQGLRKGEGAPWCIQERSNGDLWRGLQHGALIISHPATHTTERLEPPIFHHSTIRQIAEDRNGDLWLGTQAGDLIKWIAATNTFVFMQALHSSVIRLYFDWKGDCWVCTPKNGLFHIRPSDGAILYNYLPDKPGSEKLSTITTNDIVQISDSLYAVASDNLCLLNVYTGEIQVAKEGLEKPFEGITNLIQDKKGYLWITTRTGICRLNPHKAARSNFSEADGVGSNAFNPGSSCILRDGRVAFGTAHDIIAFRPDQITGSSQPPPDVEITGIAVMNKWLPMDSSAYQGSLELAYDENSIRFAFSTLTYQNTFAITYQMENLDHNWISARSNEAVYNYLPPGSYTFRITARNAEDATSPHVKEIHILIRGPFWRTWWFLGFLLLVAAVLLYWLDRQRMQKKEAMERMRSDISRGLHEEVNQALQNINVLSEIARIRAQKHPQQSISYIDEIHHKSHNMIIAMDDMLWSIDPANDTMDKAIDRMREFAGALSRRHNAHIELQAEEAIRTLRPDMKVRHEFLLIYKLALRMLVEEIKVSNILIQLDYQHPHLHLTFFSTEVLPDERSTRYFRLLEEMKTRAQAIHGTLDIQYDDRGAAILLICPSIF